MTADTGPNPYADVEPITPRVPVVVAYAHTPLSDVALYNMARVGHFLAFGVTASYNAGIVAWAMLCLEQGRGKATHCNNFGNQDATPDWTGPVFELTADEVIGGNTAKRTKRLRAYDSPEQGAAGYWRRLASGYGAALPFFEAGDGDGAARKLKALRYYTGKEEAYATAMRSLVAEGKRRFKDGAP